jgi:thiol-disulfide isomerase/thioredoxin
MKEPGLRREAVVLSLLLLGSACSAGQDPTFSAPPAAPVPRAPSLGIVSRAQVELEHPEFLRSGPEVEPDLAVAAALRRVPPGARIEVIFGTWCGDSKRELSRFWKALDVATGAPPFEIHYVGVDRTKREPADLLAGRNLLYVPTFVVYRDGAEVGRVVESAPAGIEKELLDLLTGAASGLRTGRGDLQPAATLRNQGRR